MFSERSFFISKLILVCLSMAFLAGCSDKEKAIGSGAVVGGGLGAIIGSTAKNSGAGVLGGAVIGSAAGALVGGLVSSDQNSEPRAPKTKKMKTHDKHVMKKTAKKSEKMVLDNDSDDDDMMTNRKK